MSRLRSLDSKISFFAFADIITAVSGVLIFIALLLATDLGRPTNSRSTATDSAIEQKLEETLARQVEVDAQNHRLQELFATAETAPDLETLKSDIARLNSQLTEAQKKQAALAEQMTDSQAAMVARDKLLGLTELKATVQRIIKEAEALAQQNKLARDEMNRLEQQVAQLEAELVKLEKWDGQVWLIPEKSATSKEAIVAFVDGAGASIQSVDHPDQSKPLDKATPDADFKSYLSTLTPQKQYIVFEIKPSGIVLFKELVKTARGMGFDVGYDALEEDKNPHLTPMPVFDESPATNKAPVSSPISNESTAGGGGGAPGNAPASAAPPAPTAAPTNTVPPATSPAPPPPKNKSWWQRLLEWAGLA
jgi:hypothetical protein